MTGTFIPSLAPANHEVWDLFQLMIPGLVRQGGYDYGAIQAVLEIHGIEPERRPVLFRRCVRLIEALDKARRERQGDAD